MQQNQVPNYIFVPNSQYPQRKFTFKECLEQGTLGCIYLAQSENWKYNNKNLALKFSFKNQVSENELNFLKFIMEYQESEFEQKVPCDMIRVLDIFDFKQNNQDYIVTVMEQGDTDLYQYLKTNRTKLTEIQKIKICLDITNPIYFLHQKQMLHRDIKPEHYIQVDGKFKLIDFGLIKQSKRLQTIGVGTPIFQAPEIVEDSQNYTDKVDVWALACVFYEIFNEEALFNYVNYQQIIGKIQYHKKDQSEVFQKINKINCNQQFKQLLQNMLQPQVERRFDSSQVIGCLKEIYNKLIQQQNSQFRQPQNTKINFTFPTFQQVSNKNCDQNQVNQLMQKSEKNHLELENKLRGIIEEKEQKQLEIVKQILQKQEKTEQYYLQQIITLNQKNDQLIQKHNNDINRLENQLQVNTDSNNLRNAIQQEITLQINQNKTSLEEQLKQEISQQIFKIQQLEQQFDYLTKQKISLELQNQQEQENNKIERQQFQNSIQNLNQKMDELNGTLNTQLTFVKNQLNFNQFQLQSCKTQIQKLNQGIEQKQLYPEIEDLQQSIKDQFTQEIQNIRDELKLVIQNYQPQNQLQNEQLQKIEQNLHQQSLLLEQLRQQLDYNLQQLYYDINLSNQSLFQQQQQQQQQQFIQYISNQVNENKENCEENCKKIKQDLQNKIKNQNEIIEELQEKQSNQLKEFTDLKKQERQIFKIIVKILQEIPNFQSEKVDQLNDHILGLLKQRQKTKVEQTCQQDKVNEIQIKVGLEQYEHSQFQSNVDQIYNMDSTRQIYDSTHEERDSQQEKEQKITEVYEITSNQLNKEQENNCQVQSNEHLTQPENIQNEQQNFQEFKQNNDLNTMQNSKDNGEQQNIY